MFFPKPKKGGRAREKARDKRHEAAIIKEVRALVVERDTWCRFPHEGSDWPTCQGASEWAHLNEHSRAKTRGLPARERHTTTGTCMLCTYAHHELVDGNKVDIVPVDPSVGANGDLIFVDRIGGHVIGVA